MEKDMNMQDNELDALFRNKLHDMEAEPAPLVWDNIAAGLDYKPQANPLWKYLSIAATIVVLITAGILFMPAKQTGQQTAQNNNNKSEKNHALPAVKQQGTVQQPEIRPVKPTTPQRKTQQIAKASPVKPAKAAQTAPAPVKTAAPAVKQPEQAIAAVTTKVQTLNPVVPDDNIELTIKPAIDDAPVFNTTPTVIAAANTPQKADAAPTEEKPKKARGFGGLINTLVSKIDKRKDKLVEFDEKQRLTGINLGIVKITTEE